MALQDSSDQRTFKNTFAPHVENETLSIHDIITGLRTTILDVKKLPPEVQDAVTKELKRQKDNTKAGFAHKPL